MKIDCPRLVIAGTGSGVGKTSLAIGLARCLANQGLRVQTFKVGPDFLDPTYLSLASGRTCYNLDGWMTSRQYVETLFARATTGADIAIIEGVMGLFDGASPCDLEGSTAQIAKWLDTPVLLVTNAHGAARSLAATVQGFARFEPGVRVAGVIANQSGSDRHRDWLRESLAAAGLPPLVAAVPRGALPSLPSRHLGLTTADPNTLAPAILDQLADTCARAADLPLLLEVARSAAPLNVESASQSPAATARSIRIGIARDDAFHFYYPDNLEALAAAGVQWVAFSPLADATLPDDLDALYFGGGYPELFADRLAANQSLLSAVQRFAASGRRIYGECGGLMYLGRSLTTIDGSSHRMADVLPLNTAMLSKLKVLGYVEARFTADCMWGRAGQDCRGHEFHYSEIASHDRQAAGWQPPYLLQRRRSTAVEAEGFARGRILASYVHLHWASRPEAVHHFVSTLEDSLVLK